MIKLTIVQWFVKPLIVISFQTQHHDTVRFEDDFRLRTTTDLIVKVSFELVRICPH